MGQYWYIINIDAREQLGCWGKLGEFFSAPDSYADIISLLADAWAGCRIMCVGDGVEECPPGVLTSEERDEVKNLPVPEAEKTFITLAVETYKVIRFWTHYDLSGMVLRNLTKNIYVRGDVVVEELAIYEGDLCNVLLANICWSADWSSVMGLDLTRGGWAGDRLDVVPQSAVENKEEWEDVTEDQVKLTRFALSRNGYIPRC
ncbi:hypothetical protein DFS33DRAFT_1359479 [Desarmillaria ectypa]|nr:hypothetical protein DFS33DRAFT_1359479 [Desarmillaria ectypa]